MDDIREIPSAPGYGVTDDGRVWSYKTSRWLKVSPNRDGYLTFSQSFSKHRAKRLSVHVVVAEAFIGPRLVGMQVRHLNGDPSDNRAVNLAYGTGSDNAQDMIRHGRHNYASRTSCVNDHPFSEANTYYWGPKRYRKCRACDRDRSRRYAAARRAA